MSEAPPWIAIVDDDHAVLKALSRLLRSHALNVCTFASGKAFLASLPSGLPKCLIVDLQMPTMSGLALRQCLAGDCIHIPTIMITGQHDAALRA